ncbi:MAG: MBL fold metallo-hydrolase [Spirochaetaceae bacterium]|jgi:hydroxyacylglutathione hydrolase|nr:MBL fold metallo-hydrolase [Spirochaetaceae bacterium]
MQIEIIPAGPYGTNCYILSNDHGEAVIIDAPPESFDLARDYWHHHHLKPLGVIITHGHWDHILDAWQYKEEGINIYSHEAAGFLLSDPQKMAWMAPPGQQFKSVDIDIPLVSGPMELGNFKLNIFFTPGHSPGSVSIHWPAQSACMTGDLIFLQAVGRTDFPGGDDQLLSRSIQDCILTLPEDTRLLPGHGPETTVAHEKKHNPYITSL